MTYWVTQVDDNEYASNRASGIIANQMAAKSISKIGFRRLHYPRMYAGELEEMGEVARQERLEALLSMVLPGDVVIVQYPMWTNYTQFELEYINHLKNVRQAKIVALVWDIVSWIHDNRERDYTGDASLWMLNHYDLVIAANEKMAKRLHLEGGVNTPMISMDLSDFLYHGPLKEKKKIDQIYYVATGIDPAIIEEYQSEIPIKFIGPNWNNEKLPEYIQLLGAMKSNDIPSLIDGGFGLLYYPKSGSLKGMNHYGEYNNPMKLSLYIASGIPIITLSNTAHAKLIEQQGLGLVINSISEIDERVKNLSESEYQKMVENIKPWQRAVSSGFFAKEAAIEAIRYLELGFRDREVLMEEDK